MDLLGLTPLLQVFDMNASLAFYRDALGFEVVSASPEVETAEGRFSHGCRLRLGPVELMLNTAYDSDERPPEREAGRWAGHGDAGLFLACADVDASHADLTRRGVAADAPTLAPYGRRRFTVHDPDAYALTFQAAAR